MKSKPRILIVDDEVGARESLRVIFDDLAEVHLAQNPDEADQLLKKSTPDLMFLDLSMPGRNGMDYLDDLKTLGHSFPVIMVTATKNLKTAVMAMKKGAMDYITKPFNVDEIKAIFQEALFTDTSPSRMVSDDSKKAFHPESVIGFKTTLKPQWNMIQKLSQTDSTVLILGESGTGKELIARSIHFSRYGNLNTFVPLHLGAITENLLESELFGHNKGAFTGAEKDRKGAVETAENGTLFLDEISEIPENVQIKLLRLIQEREYKPVGCSKIRKTNTRIVAATNKNLYELVQAGKFRADLYYRLNVIPVKLPPLRDRLPDLPEMVLFLTQKICHRLKLPSLKVSSDVMDYFYKYGWPGNIRELENTLERMIVTTSNSNLSLEDIPDHISLAVDGSKCMISDDKTQNLFENLEREAIEMALVQNGGVLTSAAKYLGTTRRILKYKMDKLGITKTELFQN